MTCHTPVKGSSRAPLLFVPNSSTHDSSSPYLRDKLAAYYTLGCKLNFSETSTIAGDLEKYGVTRVEEGNPADICIINTCTVTSVADRKARTLIHRVVRENPGAAVVVTGCYAQLCGDQILSIPGVSMVVGAGRKSEIVAHLLAFFSPDKQILSEAPKPLYLAQREHMHIFEEGCSRDDRTRHFLKVQDGCNYACSYCTIPKARGKSRNGSIESLVKQAHRVAEDGGKEIVLTGVNIGDFGRTTKETLTNLVRALDKVEGIERYRISSLEPDLISDELIDVVAEAERFMPHWHIPLQSGNDQVLKLMRRQYRTPLFAERLERITKVMPEAFIGIDVIVGMRGETDELFEESRCFLTDMPFTRLHIFPYSERAETDALKIAPIISPAMKKIRAKTLLELSNKKIAAFFERFRGQERPVLWERSENNGHMCGFTDNYIRLVAPYNTTLAGIIAPAIVGIQETGEEYCSATPVIRELFLVQGHHDKQQ